MVLNLSLFQSTVEQTDGAKHSTAILVLKRDLVLAVRLAGRSLTKNTIPDVLIQFDLLMVSTVLLETCRGL